jgi:hypothetical protein
MTKTLIQNQKRGRLLNEKRPAPATSSQVNTGTAITARQPNFFYLS